MANDIIKRVAAAMNAFTKIGTQNGSAPPHDPTDNKVGLVYEALIASRLKSAADARKDAAIERLREAGILDADYSPGDHAPYSGSQLAVHVKRNKNSETLDKTALLNAMSKKMPAAEAAKIIKEASKPRKGNTTISVGIV